MKAEAIEYHINVTANEFGDGINHASDCWLSALMAIIRASSHVGPE